MKLQRLLHLKRNDIKIVGIKTVGYVTKNNKRIKFSVDKVLISCLLVIMYMC